MTNQASGDELREAVRAEIKYRVKQEYEKYHNDTTFEYNGVDFWRDQIEYKLSDTLVSLIRTEKLKLLDRLESKAFYDPSGTSPLINPREIQAERNKLEAEL